MKIIFCGHFWASHSGAHGNYAVIIDQYGRAQWNR